MKSIFSESSLQKLETIKKYLLIGAVWVLVGAVVLGAITILFSNNPNGLMFGKFLSTLLIISIMMATCVNNFKCIESRKADVQAFALLGLVFNVLWTILWIIVNWTEANAYTGNNISILMKAAMISTFLSILGLIGSNTLNIYEGEKKGIIRPLKITAVICATYEFLYFTVEILIDNQNKTEISEKLAVLAAFTGCVWIFVVLSALVISRREQAKMNSSKEKASEIKATSTKSEEELRAEIEEKVRKEMIEKEVRARLEAESEQKKNKS